MIVSTNGAPITTPEVLTTLTTLSKVLEERLKTSPPSEIETLSLRSTGGSASTQDTEDKMIASTTKDAVAAFLMPNFVRRELSLPNRSQPPQSDCQ